MSISSMFRIEIFIHFIAQAPGCPKGHAHHGILVPAKMN